MGRVRRAVVTVVASVGLAVPLVAVNAPEAQACSYHNNPGTWPLCEVWSVSIPRYSVGGGRPPLTPKDSAWCRNDYIKASNTGYTYWALTDNRKYDLWWWPDYYSRLYQLMYWNPRASQWQWVIPNSDYPAVGRYERANCDA